MSNSNYLHVEVCEELPFTKVAGEPLHSIVYLHVFVQVRLLSELVLAAWDCAFKWALSSVNAKMIIEVVPFPEELAVSACFLCAFGMVTL
jgi:hypothetical protein